MLIMFFALINRLARKNLTGANALAYFAPPSVTKKPPGKLM